MNPQFVDISQPWFTRYDIDLLTSNFFRRWFDNETPEQVIMTLQPESDWPQHRYSTLRQGDTLQLSWGMTNTYFLVSEQWINYRSLTAVSLDGESLA
jgi:hypothetical protein